MSNLRTWFWVASVCCLVTGCAERAAITWQVHDRPIEAHGARLQIGVDQAREMLTGYTTAHSIAIHNPDQPLMLIDNRWYFWRGIAIGLGYDLVGFYVDGESGEVLDYRAAVHVGQGQRSIAKADLDFLYHPASREAARILSK